VAVQTGWTGQEGAPLVAKNTSDSNTQASKAIRATGDLSGAARWTAIDKATQSTKSTKK